MLFCITSRKYRRKNRLIRAIHYSHPFLDPFGPFGNTPYSLWFPEDIDILNDYQKKIILNHPKSTQTSQNDVALTIMPKKTTALMDMSTTKNQHG